MINVLVTGSNGQLGSELRELAAKQPDVTFTFTDLHELDITDYDAIKDLLSANQFDYCINCAAYTAVDEAEKEIDLALKINVEAVAILAEATHEAGVKLIHISTDFVFDGKKSSPYLENDLATPLNIYGRSKWKGELECIEENPDSLIIRTSWLYSSYGKNFVKTMRRLGKDKEELGVISDQVGVPTYARDLANALVSILYKLKEDNVSGILHYSNEGVASWYDFAEAIMEFSDLDCNVKPIPTAAYPTPARRAAYSVLNTQKIKSIFGLTIPYWRDSLKACIQKIEADERG